MCVGTTTFELGFGVVGFPGIAIFPEALKLVGVVCVVDDGVCVVVVVVECRDCVGEGFGLFGI